MEMGVVPTALRERLGVEATAGLQEWADMARREWVAEAVTLSVERFERRLIEEVSTLRVDAAHTDAALRQEMATGLAAVRHELTTGLAGVRQELTVGLADVRHEIATSRVELLRWSFVFWIGQVIAMAGILGAVLRRG